MYRLYCNCPLNDNNRLSGINELVDFLNSFRNFSNAGSHKLKIRSQFGKALPAIFDANGVSCLPT